MHRSSLALPSPSAPSLPAQPRCARRFRRDALVVLAFGLAALCPANALAQLIGVQGVYVPASDTRRASLGIGADIGHITRAGPVDVWAAVAVGYQRQTRLGPGRGRVSGDLRLLPAIERSWLVPFIGVSASANRSGGQQSEWQGTRFGLDGLAGVVLNPYSRVPVGISLEERFGYVRGQEHALATQIGLRFRL